MSDDPELERRLEAMFGSLKPRAEFHDRLRERLRSRRPWWSQPALLWLAAAVPALILAFAVLTQLPHGASSTATGVSFQKSAAPRAPAAGAAAANPARCISPLPLNATQAPATTPTPSPTPCQ